MQLRLPSLEHESCSTDVIHLDRSEQSGRPELPMGMNITLFNSQHCGFCGLVAVTRCEGMLKHPLWNEESGVQKRSHMELHRSRAICIGYYEELYEDDFHDVLFNFGVNNLVQFG